MDRWYTGFRSDNHRLEAFPFPRDPRPEDTPRYLYIIGPFVTKRGALWAEKYGTNNPHFQHVSDAERLSKKA